ncbi:MAG TPA: response regulator transcription factor [Steroidobacteraceae bacterium]|nr:response regulator transcription factor [Steroidobacteraceae bacterium]
MTYTVLIVDDSKLARMSVAKVLSTLHPDWKRIEAANATEALQQTRDLSPEVVLVDFNMPGKDGVTLAAELRVLDPRISVAVVSANRQVEVIKRTQAAGATFLPKPVTETALADFLSSAIERQKADSR